MCLHRTNYLSCLRKSILFFLLWVPCLATAGDQNQSIAGEKILAGWVEIITVEDFPNVVKAKFDTGARTSSIHAVNIEQFKKKGKRWVRFDLKLPNADGDETLLPMEKPVVRNVKIKNHEGEPDKRPVIELNICFNNKRYNTQFNLVDRSRYIYPVLIGRRFLAENVVVDSAQTFLTLAECTKAE